MQLALFPWFQTIGIPTGIDPTPFRANLHLYNYKCKYSANLIRTNKLSGRQFHSTFGFIDDLCTNFLDLNISVNKGKLIYKMSDKRDTFNFQIIERHQLQVTYHLSVSIVPLCQNL